MSDYPTDALPPTNDPEVLAWRRRRLRDRVCPICEAGPYKVVLVHVSKKHGIERREMRELCGLTYTESLLPPELHERYREMWFEKITDYDPGRSNPTMSTEGRRRAGQRIKQWAEGNPGEAARVRAVAGKKGGSLSRPTVKWTPKLLGVVADVYRGAEDRPAQAVAEAFDISLSFASKLIRRSRDAGLLEEVGAA